MLDGLIASLRQVGRNPDQALDIVKAYAKQANWLRKNGGQAADFYRLQKGIPEAELRAMTHAGLLTKASKLSGEIRLSIGGVDDTVAEAQARLAIERLATKSLRSDGGGTALREVLDVSDVLRSAAEAAGREDSALVVGKLARDLSDAMDAPNAVKWWESRLKGGIGGGNVNGRWGYVFEVEQAGRLARAGQLDDVEGLVDFVDSYGNSAVVQVDMFSAAGDGRRILTEIKSSTSGSISATSANRDQMYRQSRAVSQDAQDLAKELRWVLDGNPTSGLRDYARAMADEHGIVVRLLDRYGNDFLTYVPG